MKKFRIVFLCFIILSFSFAVFAGSPGDEDEKFSVKAYGYIKLDALYETGNSSHGNYAMWARDPGGNKGLFSATAKETRLGLTIVGFHFGKFKVTGKIEVDFYGSLEAENKPYNYMRHAYLQVSDGSLTVTAGQTWDIINPLNPATLNYSVLWGAGNIGFRRPQLSIRKDIKAGKNVFTLEAGIFRTISKDYNSDGVDDGVASGFPTIQGRIAGKFSLGEKAFLQLGASGHYGKTKSAFKNYFNNTYTYMEFTSNSLNADFLLVLSPKFKILAEFFSGKNLDPYLGGITQPPMFEDTIYYEKPIYIDNKARGFFVNVIANPSNKLRLSAGLGIDDPSYDKNILKGSWIYMSKNTSIFGNLMVSLSRSLEVGFEVSHWKTETLFHSDFIFESGLRTQKTTRFQNSWILSF